MTYTATHASAARMIAAKGARASFTLTTPGTYTASTDAFSSPTEAMVEGVAVEISGDLRLYESLRVVERAPVTLLFAPDTYGDEVALGALITWGGTTKSVASVARVAPDGTGIVFRVVVAS